MENGKLIPIDFQDRREVGGSPVGKDALSQAVNMIVDTERSLMARGLVRTDPEYFTEMIEAQRNSTAYNALTADQQDQAIEMAERVLSERRTKEE